jgi:ParB family transcriptional regulator, chromosome partitioning protein
MQKIPVSNIRPNPQQPRQVFDVDAMLELAASIRENGLQSPIIVEDDGDGFYTLVAGERRWRAHQMLNIPEISANVRPPTNHAGKQRLIDAMVENIQRESMTPVEEAHGFRRMRDDHGMTVSEIAKATGTAYNQVVARLRITELEPEIQELIANKALPGSQQSVDALIRVPAGDVRVKLAKALAGRSATIRMVQAACDKVAAALATPRPAGKYASTPSLAIAAKKAGIEPEDIEDKWDVLYQINRVPPWPMYVETVQATCRACSLFAHASDATCRDCPLVDSAKRLMEAIHARRN